MTLAEQVYAQAVLLAGELDDRQEELLKILCVSAAAALAARLRDGITGEDCGVDFVTAASLMALAALNETADTDSVAEFKAGDLTVKRGGGDAASRCLRRQAEILMGPYLKDRFAFRGV